MGALRDGALRLGALRDGELRLGALRDGVLREGALRDGVLRDGVLRDGVLRDREGALNEGDREGERDGCERLGLVRVGLFEGCERAGGLFAYDEPQAGAGLRVGFARLGGCAGDGGAVRLGPEPAANPLLFTRAGGAVRLGPRRPGGARNVGASVGLRALGGLVRFPRGSTTVTRWPLAVV